MFLMWLIYVAVLIIAPGYEFLEISRYKRSSDYVNCDKGWFYYNEKCYKVGGRTERLTWQKAADRCVTDGGFLVTIQSKDELEFLIAIVMVEVRESAWIGLNDRDNESVYTWVTGSSDYRNWRDGEPSGIKNENEDCVELVVDFMGDSMGLWNDVDCSRSLAYICETNKNSAKRSPNPQYCSAEDGGGFRFQSSCYHFVLAKKSWEIAEQHCVDNFKGHLITVLYGSMDLYLDYLLKVMYMEMWIGIKIQPRLQQKWSSGWYVGYNGFSKEHRDFLEGTCVVRSKQKEWNIVPCSKEYAFMCEVSKVKAPILKPPVKDAYCPKIPNDWRDLDGEFCYFFQTNDIFSWHEASFTCKQRGGHLLSIHSKEESDILHPFIQYTQIAAFVGLFRLLGKENTFVWTDGSPTDFINWSPWEPNNENEKCVEARSSDMQWNDVDCNWKRAFICAVSKVIPNMTEETTDESNAEVECSGSISVKALLGVAVCIILVIILLGIIIYFYRPWIAERRNNSIGLSIQPPTPPPNRPKYRSSDLNAREQEPHYEDMNS